MVTYNIFSVEDRLPHLSQGKIQWNYEKKNLSREIVDSTKKDRGLGCGNMGHCDATLRVS